MKKTVGRIAALATIFGLMAQQNQKEVNIPIEDPLKGYEPNLISNGFSLTMKQRGEILNSNRSRKIKRKRLLAQKKRS